MQSVVKRLCCLFLGGKCAVKKRRKEMAMAMEMKPCRAPDTGVRTYFGMLWRLWQLLVQEARWAGG